MNILLTSVGRRSYMINYFKEVLQGQGMVHASNSAYTHALVHADAYTVTPMIYDEGYIDYLINYSKANDIKAIISLFDIDLPVLAKNKTRFESECIDLIVSNEDFVQICNDKWLTYNFLKNHDFFVPLTYLDIQEVKDALKQNLLNYPLIIKPRWGMGSIGIFSAENELELDILYTKTLNEISKSYLKYESKEDINKAIIIQEKLNGQEYGMDVFNDLQGNNLAVVPKRKIAMRAGETDMAEILQDENMVYLGKKLANITRHIANLDVDYFVVDGKMYILEMNARFGGQYPFSHLSGVNFPKAIIHMILNQEVDSQDLTIANYIIGAKELNPVIVNRK